MNEYVVMDEHLEISEERLEKLISDYFFRHISIQFNMDVTWQKNGSQRIWVVLSLKGDKKYGVINGYYQIEPESINPNEQKVHCRIVSCREEISAFWFELAEYIRVSLLIPLFRPEMLTTPLSKQIILGSKKEQLNRVVEDPLEPWLCIPDLWDQEVVKLWWSGLSNRQIGERLSLQPVSVTKKLYKLRKEYSKTIVPLKKDFPRNIKRR